MRLASNPYRWDLVDPGLFYGRQELAASLTERLLAGDRFAVAGGRRIGKTTLLRKLEAALAEIDPAGGLIVLPVFLDVAELAGASAEDAYRLLGQRVAQAARVAGLPFTPNDVTTGPDLADALRALLDAARWRGRLQMVFLFDEIERVLAAPWGPGFLAHWRMLLNNAGELSRCLSIVVCGARDIYRIAQDAGSPLGNILAWQELEAFSLHETARLLREPTQYPWPDEAVGRVFEASGGQPCLIQYLAQRLCERDTDAWPETLAAAESRFLREHATMFSSWWQSFEESAREIYAVLVAAGSSPGGPSCANPDPSSTSPSSSSPGGPSSAGRFAEGELIARFAASGSRGGHAKRALDVLAHTGVIRWDRDARTVEAAGTLFQRWAERHALSERALVHQPPVPTTRPSSPLSPTAHPAASPQPAAHPASASQPDAPPLLGTGRRIGTVLFTDIVSSTRMTAELGDRGWLDLVSAHNARVREVLAAFRGHEVKTMGDGFLALFESPAAAIRCACEIAASVRPLGLEVRAGLHAGEYEAVGDDVIGIAISYAAWVMSWAQGGEVIVSETVRGLVAGSGIRFVDRGAHRVKGTRERHRLYAVDHQPDPPHRALP